MASGSTKPNFGNAESREDSDRSSSGDANDKTPLLSGSSDYEYNTMIEAFYNSVAPKESDRHNLEKGTNSDTSQTHLQDMNDRMKTMSNSLREFFRIHDKEKMSAVGSKNGDVPPTKSAAEMAPHQRQHRCTVHPSLSDPAFSKYPKTPIPWHLLSAPLPPTGPLTSEKESVDSSQYLGSDEPTPSPFESRQNSDETPPVAASTPENQSDETTDDAAPLVQQRNRLIHRYAVISLYVTNSYGFVPILLLLTGLSVYASYMGITYYSECEFIQNITMLIASQGFCMACALMSRLIHTVLSKYSSRDFWWLRYSTSAGIFNFVVIYLIGFFYFNFHPGQHGTERGPNYCDPFFYDYVLWNNWVTGIILIVMAIVLAPLCCIRRTVTITE